MDKLLRRMDELTSRLNEETRLRQIAENNWNELKQSVERNQASTINVDSNLPPPPAASTIPVQSTVHHVRSPKIATPDKFDGTKGQKAEVFINQMGLYMQMNSQSFCG